MEKETFFTLIDKYLDGSASPAEATLLDAYYDRLSSEDKECLHFAKEMLVTDFEKPLSLKQVARKSSINEFKLKKGFKHLFGNSVFAYRHSVRMEKARLILLETALPIHDLAFMIGFEHPENFQKAFKKYWEYTPTELRKGK